MCTRVGLSTTPRNRCPALLSASTRLPFPPCIIHTACFSQSESALPIQIIWLVFYRRKTPCIRWPRRGVWMIYSPLLSKVFTPWCCDAAWPTADFPTWWITYWLGCLELKGAKWGWEVWLNPLNWSLVRINIKGMENTWNERRGGGGEKKMPDLSREACRHQTGFYFGKRVRWDAEGCVAVPEEPPAAGGRKSSPVCISVSSGVSNSRRALNNKQGGSLKQPTRITPQDDDIIARRKTNRCFLLCFFFFDWLNM